MRGHKLKRDVVINLVFSLLNAVLLLAVIRLASSVFSPVVLGLFLLTRRYGVAAGSLFQWGTTDTLLRFIPSHQENARLKRGYVAFAVLVWSINTIVGILLAFVFADLIAGWLFPETANTQSLAFWTIVLAFALVINYLAGSTLFAERRMVGASLIRIMSSGGFLIMALFLYGALATPVNVLRFQALAVVCISIVVVCSYLFLEFRGTPWPDKSEWRTIINQFASYGLLRTVIPFMDQGLFLIGPLLLRHEVEEAGYLIIALTVMRMLQVLIQPVSQVALVATARYTGRNDESSIDEGVKLVFGTGAIMAALALAVLLPWSRLLINLWLPDEALSAGVIPYVSIVLWALPPFVIFASLKGIIEARWYQPLNLYTLLLASVVSIALFYLVKPIWGSFDAISISILSGFWLLGLLTIFWVRSYLDLASSYWGWPILLLMLALVLIINVLFSIQTGILWAIAAGSISIGIVVIFLFVLPTPFLLSVRNFLLPKRR